ncbi:MAG: hypothetical protein EZS28_030271, partial [Streblomastix strix]
VQDAITGTKVTDIDFWATNILDEQNCAARSSEIQCTSILPITSELVPDEVLDSKRSPIDKILQSEQALALCNFRLGEGILAHLCEQQEENLAIVVLCQMSHKLMETESVHLARSRNENWTNANYFNLAANSINTYMNRETGSHISWEKHESKRKDFAS